MPLPPILPTTAAAVSLVLAGCGGAEPAVDAVVAEDLAQRAERVATALAAGDGCSALERTTELESATASARDAGEVTGRVAAEILSAAQRISADTTCAVAQEPDEQEEPEEPDEQEEPNEQEDGGEEKPRQDRDHDRDDDDDDEGDGADKRGRGQGRGKGHGNDDDD